MPQDFKKLLTSFCFVNNQLILFRLSSVKKIIQGNVHPPSTERSRCPYQRNCTEDALVFEGSEQADQTLSLLNLLLDLVTGGGYLSLSGQNGTQEGGQGSSYCCVERPAEGTQSWPEGQGLGAAVADHFL